MYKIEQSISYRGYCNPNLDYVKELTIVFTKQSDDIEDFDYNNLKPKFAYYLQTYHDIKMNRQYGFTEVNYGKYDKKTTKYSNKIFIDGKLALEPASVYDFNAYKAELTANGFSTTGSVSTDISSKEETWMDWAGKYVHLPNHTVSYITGGLHLHLVDNLEEGDEFTAYYRITECKRSNLTIEMKIIWKPAKRVNKKIVRVFICPISSLSFPMIHRRKYFIISKTFIKHVCSEIGLSP